tara:strand:+ start:314 stop:916 length:603 start_codon:yes stop_codon:yes gene_type:complete
MKQQIKINKVKGNPKNPRIIKDKKFKELVKSITELPEMLELRPIIVDEDMMILGGNMRYRAAKEAGLKEIWVDTTEGWSQEKKDEFVIKDNVTYGEWDWAMLANDWNSTSLVNWSLDVWQNYDDQVNKVNKGDENSEWVGMPDFEPKNESINIVITFKDNETREDFVKKIDLKLSKGTGRTWSTTYPYEERRDLSSLSYE